MFFGRWRTWRLLRVPEPGRRSGRTNFCAASELVTLRLARSQWSCSSERMATSPRSRVSVTRPSNSKFPPGLVLPPLQASSHSRRLPGERGKVFGGQLESAHARFGNEFWIGAVEAAKDFAASPTQGSPSSISSPSPFRGRPSSSSSGRAWFQAAVVPGEFNGRHATAGSEM